MLTKHFNEFELKVEGDGRTITGYGSIFGNADLGGDIVAKGAFVESIKSRKPKMLYQHDPNRVIGVWNSFKEDEKGLQLEGKLADTPLGNEIKELIRIEAVSGLSIGYKVNQVEFKGDNRIIKSANLYEVSVVTFPMNEQANIISMKNIEEYSIRDLEEKLREAGLSKSVAQTILSGGYSALHQPTEEQKSNEELVSALKKLNEILTN